MDVLRMGADGKSRTDDAAEGYALYLKKKKMVKKG